MASRFKRVKSAGRRFVEEATDIAQHVPLLLPTNPRFLTTQLEDLERGASAVRGGLTERGPIESIKGIGRGFKRPKEYPSKELPLVKEFTGESRVIKRVTGKSVSRKRIAAEAANVITDPLTYVGVGTVGKAGKELLAARKAKAITKLAEEIPVDPTVTKLINLVKGATKVPASVTKAELRKERGRRAAISQRLLTEGGYTPEALKRSRAALGGELPKAEFAAPGPNFTEEETIGLLRTIDITPKLRGKRYDKETAIVGLQKAMAGQVPSRSEMRLLELVFGKGLPEALLSQRGTKRKITETALDLTGLPRALKASMDLSAPLRQGALLVRRKEWWGAWGPQLKAFANEKYAADMDDVLRFGDDALRRDKYGVELTELSGVGKLGSREEDFASRLANKIPGIKQSQRAYTTFLNKLRADVFDHTASRLDDMVKSGQMTPEQLDQELTDLGRWINIATGRGHLPQKWAESDLMVLANRLFFSPRLNIARIQTFGEAGKVITGKGISPEMRKEVALDLVGYMDYGLGVLALGKQTGMWDIELDPRSSDFAKGRAGPVRFDPWGGFQPLVKLIAQLQQGEAKAATSGKVRSTSRGETIIRFARSKLDPGVPALVVDLLTGETFVGDEVNLMTKQGLLDQASARFMPLTIDDITEAARTVGAEANLLNYDKPVENLTFKEKFAAATSPAGLKAAIAVAGPSIVGMGISSFGVPQQELAEQGFYKTDKQAWEAIKENFTEFPKMQKHNTYESWYKATLKEYADSWEAKGRPGKYGNAESYAEATIRKNSIYKAMSKARTAYEDLFIKNNPELARVAEVNRVGWASQLNESQMKKLPELGGE